MFISDKLLAWFCINPYMYWCCHWAYWKCGLWIKDTQGTFHYKRGRKHWGMGGAGAKTLKNETEELEEKAYILGVVWLTQANEEEK